MKKTIEVAYTWKHENVTVELWHDHWFRGRERLGYRLVEDGQTIFEGNDFSPSPMYAWDSEVSVIALLDFLTLCPGDADEEYFEDHTPEQLDWVNGDTAEELRYVVYDWESGEND